MTRWKRTSSTVAIALAMGAAVLAIASASAQVQAPQQPPTKPPPTTGDDRKSCPESIDCMPTTDRERAERCAWVRQHCPNTRIYW